MLPAEHLPTLEAVMQMGYGYQGIWLPEIIQKIVTVDSTLQSYLLDNTRMAAFFIERLTSTIKRSYLGISPDLLLTLEEHAANISNQINQGAAELKTLSQVVDFFNTLQWPAEFSAIKTADLLSCFKEAWANRLYKISHAKEMHAIKIDLCQEKAALPGAESFLEFLF